MAVVSEVLLASPMPPARLILWLKDQTQGVDHVALPSVVLPYQDGEGVRQADGPLEVPVAPCGEGADVHRARAIVPDGTTACACTHFVPTPDVRRGAARETSCKLGTPRAGLEPAAFSLGGSR